MQTHRKNVVQIKKYSNYYKVTLLKNVISGKLSTEEKEHRVKKGQAGHDKKLKHSLSRTKTQVLEKALCNDWNWFCSLTLDGSKYPRDNLDLFIKDLSQFIRDKRKQYNLPINYLLIPELHKDGVNWHMHGLLSDLPSEEIGLLPVKKLREKGYINWTAYEKKFGFNSFGSIRDPVRCSLYVTKYISKSVCCTPVGLNKKLYYCSRGLKTAPKVIQGNLVKPLDFEMAFNGLYSKSMFVNSIEWFKDYFETFDDD